MQFSSIFRILGVLLMLFSISMLMPAGIALLYDDSTMFPFTTAFGLTYLTGFLMWLPMRKKKQDLRTRDGFLVVVLFWSVLSFFGALPFIIAQQPQVSVTDAIFESVSGLTATGSNVFIGLDHLPHAILFYRQLLQFLGGMGIIVLAVAVLPMLGIGGMQLYRAETPGPIKDNKLTPRITETAKTLWYIYVGLNISCAIAYWVAGMSLFDAIGESFSTIATGGFSTHDASFAYYNSSVIDVIGITFMILGAVNFGLHYLYLQGNGFKVYWRDLEFKAFLYILAIVSTLASITLLLENVYPTISESIKNAVFSVVSLGTTTGLTNSRFDLWPSYVPILLMLTAMVGGCAASTAGGIKIIRLLLLQKQGSRELKRLIHPKAVLPLKFGDHVLPEQVIQAIWGFVAVFLMLFLLLVLLLVATGLDLTTAFGSVASCISNTGASIGDTAINFATMTITGKWILIFAMLAGRLEIFSLMVLFTAAFWKR